jgi:RNA polymerase sigma factor (sigma-70 family)
MGTMTVEDMELELERARLVRLCARLTGDPGAAEDLAQETLVEAYRSADRLREPERRREWLNGIARNVCRRRWRRDGVVLSPLAGADEPEPVDGFDLEVELERTELATLLDRAMALLPAETRNVLVQRYVEESPVGEIAGRLGLTEGAVTMRLQRGKLTLKRVLTTGFREEAAAYGLVDDGWQTTRIWCPLCGRHRLAGRFSEGHDRLELSCAGCDYASDARQSRASDFRWDDVTGFRPTLSRIFDWHRRHHVPGLLTGRAPCPCCGRPTPLELEPPDGQGHPWITSRCPCGGIAREGHAWLMLSLPEVRHFWRAHVRIRFAGTSSVDGAMLTSYEAVGSAARLDVIAHHRSPND